MARPALRCNAGEVLPMGLPLNSHALMDRQVTLSFLWNNLAEALNDQVKNEEAEEMRPLGATRLSALPLV
jgi:hypothetical protein